MHINTISKRLEWVSVCVCVLHTELCYLHGISKANCSLARSLGENVKRGYISRYAQWARAARGNWRNLSLHSRLTKLKGSIRFLLLSKRETEVPPPSFHPTFIMQPPIAFVCCTSETVFFSFFLWTVFRMFFARAVLKWICIENVSLDELKMFRMLLLKLYNENQDIIYWIWKKNQPSRSVPHISNV